jgi:heat shock protein HslJ
MSNRIILNSLFLILSSFTILFAGCASTHHTSANIHPNALQNTYWILSEINNDHVQSQPSNLPNIQFSEMNVMGLNGCNRYVGSYEIKGDRIDLYKMATTARDCSNEDPTHLKFKNALAKVKYFSISNENLSFFDAHKNQILKFSSSTK